MVFMSGRPATPTRPSGAPAWSCSGAGPSSEASASFRSGESARIPSPHCNVVGREAFSGNENTLTVAPQAGRVGVACAPHFPLARTWVRGCVKGGW